MSLAYAAARVLHKALRGEIDLQQTFSSIRRRCCQLAVGYGPDGQRVLLSLMTRSQSPNQEADPVHALIAKAAGSVPWLTGQG
jgi:hypothetical protein